VNSGTEKPLGFHTTAALSCSYDTEQREALSIWDEEERPQLLSYGWESPVILLCFPSATHPGAPQEGRSTVSSTSSLNGTCFRGQILSSSSSATIS